jgi:hypothetical protein
MLTAELPKLSSLSNLDKSRADIVPEARGQCARWLLDPFISASPADGLIR